jgi:sortase A
VTKNAAAAAEESLDNVDPMAAVDEPASSAMPSESSKNGNPKVRRHPTLYRATSWAFAGVGLLGLWLLLFSFVLSGIFEHTEQRNAYALLRAELTTLASTGAPIGGVIPTGSPVAVINGPQGTFVNEVVLEGTTSQVLESGPGHVVTTPLPGQAGDAVVFGRSVTYGGPFKHVSDLRVGDVIVVTTGQGTFHYRVEGTRTAGDPIPAPVGGTQGRLTLVTSQTSGLRSIGAATGTVFVDALLTDPVVATPTGRPQFANINAAAMRGQPGSWVPLVLVALAMALVSIALCWMWLRWGPRQTWLVGLPIVCAILWLGAQTATQLLPNIY